MLYSAIGVCCFCGWPQWSLAQSLEQDLRLIQESHRDQPVVSYYVGKGNHARLMAARKGWAILNPLQWVAGGSMYVYQNIISPQMASDCPYEITCSNFSKHAIGRFGLLKGVFLSADRLMRCTPYAHGEIPSYRIHPQTGQYLDPLSLYQSLP